MKKYEEEFLKSTERNRMSFIATLVLAEMLESGKITKEEVIAMIDKNAEEQKHPERSDDLVTFFETANVRGFLNQFGWRIFDLTKFHEERKRSREEIHANRIKAHEQRMELARKEKAAKKGKGKQAPKNPEPAPQPKRRIIVIKKPAN